jgi:hypothetical protein
VFYIYSNLVINCRLFWSSAPQSRASSRLSGFFTHLINRHTPAPSPILRSDSMTDDPGNAQVASSLPSRSTSPQPPRTATPPPPLPPPTLQELGLSLSVLTSNLSPSHFSTAPSSGTFMAPHYLLLCHAQGLDVLPLLSPPAPQPYALVRRVSFKSVVVMEQRGVLVAIAGRRDGVRVYALDEVKKAIEWRIDVEIRRERDRMRRDASKKMSTSMDTSDLHDSVSKKMGGVASAASPSGTRNKPARRASLGPTPVTPPIPRKPSMKRVRPPTIPHSPEPAGRPPPYSNGTSEMRTPLRSQNSAISLRSRTRGASVSDVLSAAPSRRNTDLDGRRLRDPDSKSDWTVDESSDDEAINVVAAGSSGSQALDERTSARLSASRPSHQSPVRLERPAASPTIAPRGPSSATIRRNRPATLDLTRPDTNTVLPPEPSPTPTLLTLRQALSQLPSSPMTGAQTERVPPIRDEDDDDGPPTPPSERISLAQALLESRLPDVPPAGSIRPQDPILIPSSHPVATGDEDAPRTLTFDAQSVGRRSANERTTRRRRRWSVLGVFSSAPNGSATPPSIPSSPISPVTPVANTTSSHSESVAVPPPSVPSIPPTGGRRSSTSTPNRRLQTTPSQPTTPTASGGPSLPASASHSRFIPRIFSNAFHSRRSEDQSSQALSRGPLELESTQKFTGTPGAPQAPPPKLEYVKLPGTKGALMVKAVETAKKRHVL